MRLIPPRLRAAQQPGGRARMIETFVGLLTGEGVIRVFTVTAGVLTVRALAPPAFGAFAYATAFGTTLGVMLDLGLAVVVLRDASARPQDDTRLLGAALAGILLLAVPVLGLAAALAIAGVLSGVAGPVALMLGLGAGLAEALSRPWESVLLARGRARRLPFIRATRGVTLVLAVAAATLLRHPTAEAFLAASLAGSLAGSAAAALACVRLGTRPDFSNAGRGAVALLRRAMPFAMLAVSYLVFSQIDLVMLGLFGGRAATGQYGAALRVLGMALLVPVYLGAAFLTTISRPPPQTADLPVAAPAPTPEQVGRAVRAALRIGTVLAFSTAVAGPWALSLVAGRGYAPAGRLLALLSPGLLLVSAYAVVTNLQLALDRARVLATIRSLGTGFKIVANLALIPPLGARGAAISTVATELVVLLAVTTVSRAHLARVGLGFVMRLTVAVVLMVVAAALLGAVAGVPWPGVLGGGLLVFVLLQGTSRIPRLHGETGTAHLETSL